MSSFEIAEREEKEAIELFKQHVMTPTVEPVATEAPVAAEQPIPIPTVVTPPAESKPQETNPERNLEEEYKKYGIQLDPEKANDPVYLKSRFLTTAGMTKKLSEEKKAFREEADRYKNEKAQLELELMNYRNAKPNVSTEKVIAADDEMEVLKKKLKDDFDINEGFIDGVFKVVDHKIKQKEAEYIKKQTELEERYSKQEASNNQERFWNKVFEQAPEAKNILGEAELSFRAFLEQPLYKNLSRAEAYNTAYERNDHETVAQLFKDFKRETTTPQTTNQQIIPDNIKAQAQPARSMGTPITEQQHESKIWDFKEIDQIYNNVTARKIPQAEADVLLREIDRAFSEGRVRT